VCGTLTNRRDASIAALQEARDGMRETETIPIMISQFFKKHFPICPYQFSFILLCPLRSLFLSPRTLAKRLEIREDSTVLEVGPGPGYYSVPLARQLPHGKLVLADIQPQMLAQAKKRLAKRGQTNVDYYQCDGSQFDLPDNHFDAIFLITVFGEVQHQQEYMTEFFRLMKPGGILSISEIAIGDPHITPINNVQELATHAGFTVDKIYGSRWNYTANFRKPR